MFPPPKTVNIPTPARMAINLIERVHNLPPALLNHIRTEVLRFNITLPISIDTKYKFPVQLHIDSASRKEFAMQYFTNTKFTFRSWEMFFKFMSAVEDAHFASASSYSILFDTLTKEHTKRLQGWVRMSLVGHESGARGGIWRWSQSIGYPWERICSSRGSIDGPFTSFDNSNS